MFSMWFFVSLYLQEVLRFSPLVTGLGFLPQTAGIAIGAQISSRLVPRLGPRLPLLVGGTLSAAGLLWLSRAGPTGSYWASVFGGATMATFGMGVSMTPLAFAATAGVARSEAGLASGVLNTSRQVGASTALAALATIAADRTRAFLATAGGPTAHGAAGAAAHRGAALTAGFSRGLAISAGIALVGVAAGACLPRRSPGAAQADVPEPSTDAARPPSTATRPPEAAAPVR
jgi:hypothetical protein